MGKQSLYQFGRKNNVEAFILKQPNPAGARRELEQFFEKTPEYCGIRADREFILLPLDVIRTSDVVWVHLSKVKQTYLGILPMPSTYHIQFYTTGDKLYDVQLPKKDLGNMLMGLLFPQIPWAYFSDYTDTENLEQLKLRWKMAKDYSWFQTQGIQQHRKK